MEVSKRKNSGKINNHRSSGSQMTSIQMKSLLLQMFKTKRHRHRIFSNYTPFAVKNLIQIECPQKWELFLLVSLPYRKASTSHTNFSFSKSKFKHLYGRYKKLRQSCWLWWDLTFIDFKKLAKEWNQLLRTLRIRTKFHNFFSEKHNSILGA